MKLLPKIALTVALVAGITAAAQAQILSETFSYPDGPLVGATGSPWTTNSGTTGQQNVVSGRLFLNDNETEDTIAPFSSAVTSGVLSASFDLTIDPLDIPTSSAGDYITHFVNSAGVFVGRVFTLSNPGGPSDSFRIGISTTSTTPVIFTLGFTAGITYGMNLSYDFSSGLASLSATGHGTITAADSSVQTNINRYGFRQTTSTGDQFIDNLVVNAAVPEPSVYMLLGVGLLFCGQRFLRRKRA